MSLPKQLSIDSPQPVTITISPSASPTIESTTNSTCTNSSNSNLNRGSNKTVSGSAADSKYAHVLRKPNEDDDKLSQLVTDKNFFRCMLIQDIPDRFDDITLYHLFEDFGEIEKLWIHTKTAKNRHGRATIIFKEAEDAEMAEAIMNETEIQDRTLQVHIGVPPSERLKASEKREKQRQIRKLNKQRENALRFNATMGDEAAPHMFGYYPPTPMGRGRGRGRGRAPFADFAMPPFGYDDPAYFAPSPMTRGRGRGRASFF